MPSPGEPEPHRGRALRSPEGEAGFALLIVIVLLAFIVLLLVGLAAYTRIETSVAGNSQRQAQARENALLALNVALGQLQQFAGPDRRVTATAEAFENRTGTTRYVGVWPADQTADDDGDPLSPLTWLVSGNELRDSEGVALPREITPATIVNTNNGVALVSTNTTRTANDVLARLVPITTPGVPGATPGAATTIGRYAWWVGDQGVKAPVAVPDTTASVTYAPFDSADLRARLRQHLAIGAGAADAAGAVVFEPRDNNNATSLIAGQKVITPAQFAFLRNSSNGQLGLTRAQQSFHIWSPNNWAVIADTKNGGLRRDLSLAPELLGGAFAAYANYTAYMENPAAPTAPTEGSETTVTPAGPLISPEYGTDPLRRRYVMTPHQIVDGGAHQVGPVLTYFMISFNVRTEGGSTGTRPLEVRARWMVSLWNPYTSAFVPENLRIEVSGLPQSVSLVNDNPERAFRHGSISLREAFGSPMSIQLPWTADAAHQDRQSWLPGRVYTWRSKEDTTKAEVLPEEGFASDFYSQTLDDGGAGVIRPAPFNEIDGDDECHLEVLGSENLEVHVFAVRPDGPVRLGRFRSPAFVESFQTTPQAASQSGYQFSYVFRLAESIDTPTAPGTWLSTFGRDVRRSRLEEQSFVVAENGNDPAQYGDSYKKIRNPDRLLDRATDSRSYNEDVPVFELPRAPILSVGALQHFRQPNQRPFMIGNPWGVGYQLNDLRLGELFDRFFFSGLPAGVVPAFSATGDMLLPNPHLKTLRTRFTLATDPESTDPATIEYRKPTEEEFRAAPEARSSKFLLQGGAFNLNSVNAAAWASVLRGVRFPSPQSFRYLNLSESSGTASDTSVQTVQSGDAQFFRFSHSAQETYKAEPGMADSSPTREADSIANTHLFRRGMRTLTAAEVAALAAKIVELVRVKHAGEGPFRSLEEFLSPTILFAGGLAGTDRSLLEAAIEDARTVEDKAINTDIAEFSSQWLTQADVMTALAPVLFPRSDTFIIRTYGDVINPATSATEGRAWCEAIVQRVPEYLDAAADAPEVLPDALAGAVNQTNGRRFKIVSFRWLTRSDI